MSNKNQQNGNISEEEMETDPVQEAGYDTDEEGGLRVDDDIYIAPPPKKVNELSDNDPRLIITKIVNENFKSYAGKQVVGPFHKCFSAIVGPNGSGKSNVIDSMLFVFGYRASKIRSKKISVLIHNSSEHQDVRSCTVSVYFEQIIDKPGSDYDIVPNGGFKISRTAFKDNSSFYELNGKKVQFKEIAKLLRSHRVDLDYNRFLILQGEVEQIAMMKPKGQSEHDIGMLEFLEDIIGTARYKEPLNRLSEKVEVLTERRVEKLNRLRVVEKEKDDLEEPMQDAIQYLKIENIIIKLQYQLYHCKRREAAKVLTTHEEKKQELDKDFSDLTEQMSVVHKELQVKKAELKEKSKKWEQLQQKKEATTEKFDNIRKQDEALHAELVETNKRRKANLASVKTEKAKLEELASVPEKNAKTIEECEIVAEKTVKQQECEEAALATLMSGLREKTEPLLKQRSELETELITHRKNVDQVKAAFDIAKSELQLYTSVEETEKSKLENLHKTLQVTIETLKERQCQLQSFEQKIPATRRSLDEVRKDLEETKQREFEVSNKLRNMRVQVEEKRCAMNASRSRNRVLDSLMQEKQAGRLPGIFGRLGDLGAIDAKYDVAVSTACGPLDNIVVDTVATAQTCVQFLRDRDIGRATFIPLEKQQPLLQQCRQKIQTPENVPRLFDLIKVEDERVLPAFYYGVRNTLVAKDLEQATRVAYGAQRHRVVTLKGELIETSGTMSGGGRTVLKGRMGQSVVRSEPSAADIEKLEKDLEIVYQECNSLRAKQQPLEGQIQTLSNALKDMTMDKEKFTIEVRALKEQEPLLKSQLKVQEKKVAEATSNPQKVKKLTETVEMAEKKAKKVEADAKSVMDKVEVINQKIDEISGGKVKEQQHKITGLTKTIDKMKAEVCKLQVAIKTAERTAKKTEQHIEALENDVHACEQRLRDIQKEKTELEAEAKVYLEELKEISGTLIEREEATSGLKEELEELQKREGKMKAVKIDLDQQINETHKALKEIQHRIVDYGKRIDGLKLRDIPGQPQEGLQEPTEEQLSVLDEKTISSQLQKTKERLPEEIPNMQLISQYQEKDTLYLQRAAELDAITKQRNNLRDVYELARRRRTQEFLSGFSVITGRLKEMYQMITLGGDAELELVDSLDPFSEGIVFSVRPPKKSWKNISNLSGGEKTLSSLALVFALHHYKPTPLYFMDEIDAALDFKNVSIVGNYIKERTKNAQFIIISLRSNMFELADYLVGIYKTYNCTKCAPLDLAKFYERHGSPPQPYTQSASSRHIYGSQPPKSFTQNPPGKDNAPQDNPGFRSTCPGQVETTSIVREEADTSLGLPELGPCPSPLKATSPQKRSEESEKEAVEGTPDAPVRKRRKLQAK
ncbi:structural maintenance of chromosomes protein 4 [Cephus cinctus]|uniref:Structural maintenance of chromosomes protein n=1 Tax=Cephus cinctus TaxID=211228 RepID=A0AAJ7FL75_CEPCN|nr:structural maintenance of chromosomes protein 4 [Cephus cinctus]